jgi:hypothetical protein
MTARSQEGLLTDRTGGRRYPGNHPSARAQRLILRTVCGLPAQISLLNYIQR